MNNPLTTTRTRELAWGLVLHNVLSTNGYRFNGKFLLTPYIKSKLKGNGRT